MAPDVRKQRLQDACIQLILQTAAHHPVCLLVEDGHWLDPSSLEVLDGLVMAMAAQPFLLEVGEGFHMGGAGGGELASAMSIGKRRFRVACRCVVLGDHFGLGGGAFGELGFHHLGRLAMILLPLAFGDAAVGCFLDQGMFKGVCTDRRALDLIEKFG